MKSSVCSLLVVLVALASAVPVWAQAPAGVVEGTGTHFEIVDSEYLNITLDSSEPVTVLLESVPNAVTLHIEAAEGDEAAQLTLSGFEPETEYHLYQDDYHNHTPFTTDASGSYSYLQDLTSPHLVMIQPYPSTIFLTNAGWSKTGIGTWDAATKTATLTTNVTETIQIDDSGITLDGSGHTSSTITLTRGVFLKANVSGVTVRNLTITGFTYGIDMGNNVSTLMLSGNLISNCTKGIVLFKCSNSVITANTVSSCSIGIDVQTDRNAVGNTIYQNSFLGNTTQASVSGNGAVFAFNLPAPAGGNYWSNWTSPDSNHDGFVDNPFVFTGGQDNLPWATQFGWDEIAPTTTLSLTGTVGNDDWYTSAVTATLAATDNAGGSGVHSTESRLNSGAWTPYAGPFAINSDGSHVLYYRSTDNAGNVEGDQSQPVKVDQTPPLISAQVAPAPNGNGWNNTDVTVTFNVIDAASGVDAGSVTPPVLLTLEGASQLVSGSASDIAGNDATAQIAVNIDKTPPTISGAPTTLPNAAGWYNHNVIVHFTASDALSGPPTGAEDATVSTEGMNQSVTGTATDRADNSASYTVSGINIDKTPPVTAINLAGIGGGGWYRSEVTVSLNATDDLAGVASVEYQLDGGAWLPYTGFFSVAGEGAHTILYRSTDLAGNIEAAQSEGGAISIDLTPPTTAADFAGTMGDNSWYRSAVTVTLNATDNTGGSGVSSTEYALDGGAWTPYSASFSIDSEGTHQLRCRSTDLAGNVETYQTWTIKTDWTPPTIEGQRTPAANAYGWNNSDVTVHFVVSDAVSGIDGVGPADVIVSDEGSAQSVTREVNDIAGNTASATVSNINIDKTAPTIEGSRTPDANAHGWNNTDVTVSFIGSDSLSGVASVTPDVVLSSEGAGQSVEGTVTDKAGNSANYTVTGINIDKTPPIITSTRVPEANAYGWNNTDVTVTFEATDALSGVDQEPSPVTLTEEGADQSAPASATDLAGNTTSITVTGINIDKTAPAIEGSRTPLGNAYGWNNTDVTVTFTGSDALSGVASLTPDTTLSTDGANQSVTGTITDKAGNSASYTVSGINIDKTAPTIVGSRTPGANSYGWNNTDVTVSFVVSDALAGLDGPAPADVIVSTEGSGQSVTRSVSDLAGNTASATVSDINIDKTAPVIDGEATTPPNANGWYKEDVTIHFEGSDSLSGVASITPDMIITTEGANQWVVGNIVDKAGNTGTYTLTGINIDKTPPVITLTVPADGGSYLLHAAVIVNWSATDSISAIETASGTTPSGALLDTADPGDHSFSVSACDLAGNTAEKSAVYHVRYLYSGVLPPVNLDGRSVFKLGSTIPVKIQLRDAAGANVTNAQVTLSVAKLSNGVWGDELEAVSTSAATTGNLFRYDVSGSLYIFNLSTKPLSTGTWQMRIMMDDGSLDVIQFSLR